MAKKKTKRISKRAQLQMDWEAILKKHATKPLPKSAKARTCEVSGVFRRETPAIPSLKTTANETFKRDSKKYTGDKMLGIGTMHKSNSVPIFSAEEAVAISTMRR